MYKLSLKVFYCYPSAYRKRHLLIMFEFPAAATVNNPMLFDRMSVITPAVPLNSIGMCTFLKNVPDMDRSEKVCPICPPGAAFAEPPAGFSMSMVRSIRMTNLLLFCKLLKERKLTAGSPCSISAGAAGAPFACLSTNMIRRTMSLVAVASVCAGNVMVYL